MRMEWGRAGMGAIGRARAAGLGLGLALRADIRCLRNVGELALRAAGPGVLALRALLALHTVLRAGLAIWSDRRARRVTAHVAATRAMDAFGRASDGGSGVAMGECGRGCVRERSSNAGSLR